MSLTLYLDFKCPFETTRKEASKGPNDAGENAHEEGMNEEGIDGDGRLHAQDSSEGCDGFW